MLNRCGALRLNNAYAGYIHNAVLWECMLLEYWEGAEKIILK
jgi:hypothetical protein